MTQKNYTKSAIQPKQSIYTFHTSTLFYKTKHILDQNHNSINLNMYYDHSGLRLELKVKGNWKVNK